MKSVFSMERLSGGSFWRPWLIALMVHSVAIARPDAEYFYMVGKGPAAERVSLTIETTRIVVSRKGDVDENLAADDSHAAWERAKESPLDEFATALGGQPADLRAIDSARAWEFKLPDDPDRDATDIEGLIARITAIDTVAFAGPVFVFDQNGEPMFMRGTYTVRFGDSVKREAYQSILDELHAGRIARFDWTGHPNHVLVIPPTPNGFELLRTSNRVHEDLRVDFAEPNYASIAVAALTPNDPGFGLQWGFNNTGQNGGFNDVDINAPEAWDQLLTNRSVTVLIIDDGVQRNHSDLNYDTRFGRTFVSLPAFGDGSPETSLDNHGTAVAGVVAARTNNALGVSGVTIGGFVVSAKAFRQTAQGPEFVNDGIAEAIRYSTVIGAKVTNLSWVFPASNAVNFAYDDTFADGVAHFAPSGNEGAFAVRYPASHPLVIAVGAIDRTGLRASTSNRGFDLELVGPGVDIFTTDRTGSAGYNSGPNPDYAFTDGFGVDGTSYASPCGAGVAALLLRRNPRLTPTQIRQRLRETALDISPQVHGVGFDESTGWGLVRAAAALGATPAPRIGDATGDGAVDFSDTTAVLANWGTEALDGDADYNGTVDFADLAAVLANWDE